LKIHYLKHKEINIRKWDGAVTAAFNSNIYGFSWYLNMVSPNWDALVADDYEAVMPLPVATKYGITYVKGNFFTYELGVFSTKVLGADEINAFLFAIPHKFKLIDLNLNSFNVVEKCIFETQQNIIYKLDLISPYHILRDYFHKNTLTKLETASSKNIKILNSANISDLIRLAVAQNIYNLKTEDFDMLKLLSAFAVSRRLGVVYGAYDSKNSICAAAFFLSIQNKVICLLAAQNEEAKENFALYSLVNKFVADNAEKNITLDFRTFTSPLLSDIPVAFGAHPGKVTAIKRNILPWYVKILRKLDK
jgi:hypothetical protein